MKTRRSTSTATDNEDCTFVRCRLIFHGDDLPVFDGHCLIDPTSTWVMQHAAMRTLQLFRMMYASGNPQVIDGLMEIIAGSRNQTSPQSPPPSIAIE